jgi:hypothetical protein
MLCQMLFLEMSSLLIYPLAIDFFKVQGINLQFFYKKRIVYAIVFPWYNIWQLYVCGIKLI